MLKDGERIIKGPEDPVETFNLNKAYIGIGDNKPDAI